MYLKNMLKDKFIIVCVFPFLRIKGRRRQNRETYNCIDAIALYHLLPMLSLKLCRA